MHSPNTPLESVLDLSGITYLIAGIALGVIVLSARRFQHPNPNLHAIPIVGYSHSWLGSWWAGFKNMTNFANVVQQGYKKYESAPFRVSHPGHWIVVLSNRKHIEELSSAPDDIASLPGAMNESLNIEHTLGPESVHIDGQIAVIRSQLTRSIGRLYPELRDEIVTALQDVLELKDDEWKTMPVLHAIQQVVCRTSNRIFVGLPLCRDPGWIDLNIKFTIDIVKEGLIVGLFPRWMRPLAAYFIARGTRRGNARALKHLGPVIEKRLKHFNEHDNKWKDEPSDFLSWLIEETGARSTLARYVTQMMLVNFAAIHTMSSSLTTAVLRLAAHPQYIQPLREEIESIVEKEGWTKDSVAKMRKVDSLLKESQRLDGTNPVALIRWTLRDMALSDGTIIPKGTMMGAAARSLQYDEASYQDAGAFKPFRFVDAHTEDGEGAQRQFMSPAIDYLPFGLGRHACPGRFFASNEVKSMLAHIVVTYDIKLEDGVVQQPSVLRGTVMVPNPHGRILFRKRVD